MPWPAVKPFKKRVDLLVERMELLQKRMDLLQKHTDLLEVANRSDRDMILKHHEPSAFASTRSIEMAQVHKADLVLVTMGDMLAWKLRMYNVALKDPTAHTEQRENHIDPGAKPNVCNSRSPRG